MVKITLLIIVALVVVLVAATIGNNYYLIYAQGPGAQARITNFSADGVISSNVAKFILAGPWVLNVKGGNVSLFEANITTALTDGTHLHYHTMSNFHQAAGAKAELNGNNTVSIKGTMDVGLNKKLNEWPQVPTIITIKNGTVISIVLYDASKVYPPPPKGPLTTAYAHFTDLSNHTYNNHSGSQPVNGLLRQLTRTYSSTITH